jgi:glutaconate CoA-transferase subunit B
VRLPGAGGAPEIAAHARQVFVVLKQSARSFVPQVDFVSSAGFLTGGGARKRSGAPGAGPQAIITDYGVLKPQPGTEEFALVARYESVAAADAVKATGWPLVVAERLEVIAPPTPDELAALRALHARTESAHSRPVKLPV